MGLLPFQCLTWHFSYSVGNVLAYFLSLLSHAAIKSALKQLAWELPETINKKTASIFSWHCSKQKGFKPPPQQGGLRQWEEMPSKECEAGAAPNLLGCLLGPTFPEGPECRQTSISFLESFSNELSHQKRFPGSCRMKGVLEDVGVH